MRAWAIVTFLLVPALASATPLDEPAGTIVLLDPAPGGELARHADVVVRYAWPTNTTEGNATVNISLDGVPIGSAKARHPNASFVSDITIRTHVPADVLPGTLALEAVATFVNGSSFFPPGAWRHQSSTGAPVVYVGGSPNEAPRIHDVTASYLVGAGFVVDVDASDADAKDALSLQVRSEYGVREEPFTGEPLLLHAHPDHLGAHELEVTVWDFDGEGAARRVSVDVAGELVTLYDERISQDIGAHASVSRILVPPRVLWGNVMATCETSCGPAAAVTFHLDSQPGGACLLLAASPPPTCAFVPEPFGDVASIGRTQETGAVRVRIEGTRV